MGEGRRKYPAGCGVYDAVVLLDGDLHTSPEAGIGLVYSRDFDLLFGLGAPVVLSWQRVVYEPARFPGAGVHAVVLDDRDRAARGWILFSAALPTGNLYCPGGALSLLPYYAYYPCLFEEFLKGEFFCHSEKRSFRGGEQDFSLRSNIDPDVPSGMTNK